MTAPFRRKAVDTSARAVTQLKSLPAPTRGWVTAVNLAQAKPGMALQLDNFFPTETGIRPRRGRQLHATIGSDPVERVFHYRSSATTKLFAADETNIFDITTPADPEAAPTADITGQTSGYYSTALFTTSGTTVLVVVNGADKMQQYNGASWNQIDSGSTPAITGIGTDDLSHVWVYKNRLFFVEAGTLNLIYLPVDSIGGAAGTKSLGGIFKNGGELLFGATWSRDAGNGMDDLCVVVTDQGELAVFQGDNPAGSDPGDFDLVGRYDIAKPLGKNATMSAGADLLIMTEDGIVPVSAAVTKDVAALSLAAVTRAITPDWRQQVRARSGTPWEIAKWPSQNMAVVSIPAPDGSTDTFAYVVNLQTGAWCRYTNWDVRSLDVHNDKLYFGTRDGLIYEGETGGKDGDDTIYCTYVGHAEHLGAMGQTKTVQMMRTAWIAAVPFTPKVSASTNYVVSVPSPPSVAPISGVGWDLSVWDTDTWDDPAAAAQISTQWVSIGRTGFAHNPQVQVSSNSLVPMDIQLVTIDVLFEPAGIVV